MKLTAMTRKLTSFMIPPQPTQATKIATAPKTPIDRAIIIILFGVGRSFEPFAYSLSIVIAAPIKLIAPN